MNVTDIPIDQLREAPWNPNVADEQTLDRLSESISRYGLVVPLVVRAVDHDSFEVLSGNQRLGVLTALGFQSIPCIVVALDDAQAMLLAQALNAIHGDDDIGMKAELVRSVLEFLPESSVLSLLPESSDSLAELAGLGQTDIAGHLQAWEALQRARLRHLTLQLTDAQSQTVEQALQHAGAHVESESENPNPRGNAVFAICRAYLEAQR